MAKEKRIIESVCQGLESGGIPSEILQSSEANFESDKVKLVTMHSIKKLEFKVVFLIDSNYGVIPNTRLYDFDEEETYVGMTRANEMLYMSSVRKPFKFINEMNMEYLRMQ